MGRRPLCTSPNIAQHDKYHSTCPSKKSHNIFSSRKIKDYCGLYFDGEVDGKYGSVQSPPPSPPDMGTDVWLVQSTIKLDRESTESRIYIYIYSGVYIDHFFLHRGHQIPHWFMQWLFIIKFYASYMAYSKENTDVKHDCYACGWTSR